MNISQPCARRAHRNSKTYIYPPRVGMISSIPKKSSTDINFPNCWQHIPNAIYRGNFLFNIVIFLNPALEGRTGTLKRTFIPQEMAWYLQYQNMSSTEIYFPNCWQNISNVILYSNIGQVYSPRALRNSQTYIYPPRVGMIFSIPKYVFNWHILPKLLAVYIQCHYIS